MGILNFGIHEIFGLLKILQIGAIAFAAILLLIEIAQKPDENVSLKTVIKYIGFGVGICLFLQIPIAIIEKFQPQAIKPRAQPVVRLQVFQDSNGCQYLGFSNLNSLTPRLGPDGKQMGCKEAVK